MVEPRDCAVGDSGIVGYAASGSLVCFRPLSATTNPLTPAEADFGVCTYRSALSSSSAKLLNSMSRLQHVASLTGSVYSVLL